MIKRTTVRLPPELLAEARRIAKAEGRTVSSLIAEALRQVVDEVPKVPKERVMPRVSAAWGALKPPFTNLREVQEAEDLEYIERLKNLQMPAVK